MRWRKTKLSESCVSLGDILNTKETNLRPKSQCGNKVRKVCKFSELLGASRLFWPELIE